jgi:hypothetical protein
MENPSSALPPFVNLKEIGSCNLHHAHHYFSLKLINNNYIFEKLGSTLSNWQGII